MFQRAFRTAISCATPLVQRAAGLWISEWLKALKRAIQTGHIWNKACAVVE